ncbi:MAG: hypothetical protein JJE04_22900 [Acidobacteriia bacterium]|nr:hypothetical protein [Terriglobia bacterium]
MAIDRTPNWLAWVVLALLLLPLWLSSWLPTTDFTNHLARCWILSKLPADSFWAEHYQIDSWIASNRGMDLLVTPLLSRISPEIVGRLMMSLIVVLHWAGVRLLARQAGTMGWLTLVPLFFVHNSIYYMGFVNYCLSAALAVLVVSIWVGPAVHSWNWFTAVSLLVLGAATYLSHLGGTFCMTMAAAFCGAFDLWRRQWTRWKLLYYSLPFLPAAVLYLGWPPQAPDPVPVKWDNITSKLLKSMSLFTGYDYQLDAIVVALFVAGAFLAWRAGLEWEPRLAGLGLLFSLLFAVFPFTLASGSDAYTRFIIPAGIFLGTAARIRPPGRGWQAAVILLLGAMVLKMALLTGSWMELGKEARKQIELLDRVEPHSILLPLVYSPPSIAQQKRERFVSNLPAAVVYRRDALMVTTFAAKGQHPILLRKPFGLRPGVDDTFGWGRVPPEYFNHPELIDFRHVFATMDYLYTWRLPESLQHRVLEYGTLIGETGHGRLYRRR